jgi:hypothetical protein
MKIWLCTVSKDFPENYQIGIQAGKWGVESRYERRIREVGPGDLLIFIVAGKYRSIHAVESGPFVEDTPLWPPRNGDLFPHRIRIGPALYRGQAEVRDLVPKISFMKGTPTGWMCTIRGVSGIFNGHLTPEDVEVIKANLHPTVAGGADAKSVAVEPIAEVPSPRKVAIQVVGADMERALMSLLPSLDLKPVSGVSGFTPTKFEAIRVLCQGRDGVFTVVHLHRGQAPTETVLEVLHEMSWTRQNLAGGRDVRGLILSESADSSLAAIVQEVPNLSIKHYRLTIELSNGSAA